MPSPDTRDTVVRRLWMESAEAYAELARELPTYRISNRRLAEAAALRPGHRVLDLACGGGDTLEAAFAVEPRIARAWAVDWVETLVDEARRRLSHLPVTAIVAPAQDFARHLAGARVDRVLSNAAFFQFERPADVLTEVRSMLAPGGSLALTLPAPSNAGAFLELFRRAGIITSSPTGGPPPGRSESRSSESRSSESRSLESPRPEFRRLVAANVSRLLGECGWTIDVQELVSVPTSREDYIRWLTLPVFRLPDWTNMPRDTLEAKLRDALRGTDLQPYAAWLIVVARPIA